MKYINFDIENDLHSRFKQKAALNGETMKNALRRMVEEYINK